MEPNDNPLPPSPDAPLAPASGELIVQNGRQAGVRRAVLGPVTLIGRAPGCDIRLNVEGVHEHHCALFPSPLGIVLRDLGGDLGTLVNEQHVASCLLRDGDSVAVGPFRLLVRCEQGECECPSPVAGLGEVDALRVQAAAVAAQQAGLMEEEARLLQRRVALERQEEQLGANLAEKRQQLLGLRDEVRRDRAELKAEREGLEQKRQELLAAAVSDRAEAAATLEKARKERLQVGALRRRLRARWKKHWGLHEKQLAAKQQQAESRLRDMERQEQRLQSDKAELGQARLRLNGERELTRRELADERDELETAWQRLTAEKKLQGEALANQRREVEARAHAVMALARDLASRRKDAEEELQELTREAQGLENRIQNLRGGLPLRLDDSSNPPPALLLDADTEQWLERLEGIAATLADQRLALLEQWRHFAETRDAWEFEQAELLPALEESALQLDERSQQLDARKQQLDSQALRMRERKEALDGLRDELETWRSRLHVAENAWKHERAGLTARAQREEESARKKQIRLGELRKQWGARRRGELANLARELERCRELQRLYAGLREEQEKRVAELGLEHRALAERALALEQHELECVGHSADAVATEKRLAKLRRQVSAQHADAERRLAERGKHLDAEADRLTTQAQRLQERLETAAESEAAFAARQVEWEHRLLEAEHARDALQMEAERLRQQEQRAERRGRDVQAEMDRLVAILLGDAGEQAEAA